MNLSELSRSREMRLSEDGLAATRQTLSLMSRLVDRFKANPRIRDFTAQLVAGLAPRDFSGEAQACFEFVRDQVRYVRDVRDVETLHWPEQILKQRYGDCDDKCILLATMLESIACPTRFVACGFDARDRRSMSHVFMQGYLSDKKQWVSMDPCVNQPMGWQPPNIECWLVMPNDDFARSSLSCSGGIGLGAALSPGTAAPVAAVDAALTAGGGQIGSAIASVVNVVASLFGGKQHNTPSGMSYKQAQQLFKQNQYAIQSAQNALEKAQGKTPTVFPTEPADGDSGQFCQWITHWVGFYLNNPGLETSSCKQWSTYKGNGTLDSAIQAQAQYAQQLQANLQAAQATGTGGIAGNLLGDSGSANTLLLIGAAVLATVLLSRG